MRVLVTGANGFLGRQLVASLARHGHAVRALVRPAAAVDAGDWGASVEVVRADLRGDSDLAAQLAGVDAVVHLAAAMSGGDFARFQATVTATEGLFAAMRAAGVGRLILCSSFSVYDWLRAPRTLDEACPLLEGADLYARGGYAAAKSWQERLARRCAAELGWRVTIVRPGFIWGRGNEHPQGSIGASVGPCHLVFGARRRLPFTHVANAADCLRAAVENDASIGEVLNLVDDYDLSAWRFEGEYLRRTGRAGFRVPLPFWLMWPAIRSIFFAARMLLGPRIKLPFMFMPAGFAQGYRPLRFSHESLVRVLGWRPPLELNQALDVTFGSGSQH